MKVTIVQATPKPLDLISLAAGCCYGKDNVSPKRALNCIRVGHGSVAEHAVATFKIEGISRACLAQLTRHRLASFSVMSQRYCKIDTDSHDWYVKPESFCAGEDDPVLTMEKDEFFFGCMLDAARNYNDALKAGVKPEDARFLLPEACKTNLYMTMNAREIIHFAKLRLDKGAQWEIRELAHMMRIALAIEDNQWEQLIDCGLQNCEG